LLAMDALEDGALVAGDAAEVDLEADRAFGGAFDVAGPRLELARPGAAVGSDGGDADRRDLVGRRRGDVTVSAQMQLRPGARGQAQGREAAAQTHAPSV